MFGDDLTARADWQDWIGAWTRDVLPHLEGSKIAVVTYAGKREPKMALEIGYSILLNKPIVVIHMPGVSVPPELSRVAHSVIEGNTFTELGRRALAARLKRVVDELG